MPGALRDAYRHRFGPAGCLNHCEQLILDLQAFEFHGFQCVFINCQTAAACLINLLVQCLVAFVQRQKLWALGLKIGDDICMRFEHKP